MYTDILISVTKAEELSTHQIANAVNPELFPPDTASLVAMREAEELAPGPRPTADRRPLRADARRNREQLMAAARDVFVELGPDAPLDEIARRAAVGIATLYRRFPDRESLMRAVILDVLVRVGHEARTAETEEPDPV